jgi:acetyl esterase/lipase
MLCAWACGAAAIPGSAQQSLIVADIVFAQADGFDLELDLYRPLGSPGPFPCVVWIHGGGWIQGDKADGAADAQNLTSYGFAVASINYRLSAQALWPAQIHDCKAAVRFLRANAALLGLDPARIGAFGVSVGAQLAALLATTSDTPLLDGSVGPHVGVAADILAAGAFFGEYDLFEMPLVPNQQPGSYESQLIGQPIVDIANGNVPNAAWYLAQVQSVNPATFFSAGDPPLFLAHGFDDLVVPVGQSQTFYAAAVQAGVEVELRVGLGIQHAASAVDYHRRALFFMRHFFASPLAQPAPQLSVDRPITLGTPFTVTLVSPQPGADYLIYASPLPYFGAAAPFGDVLIDPAFALPCFSGTLNQNGTAQHTAFLPAATTLEYFSIYFQAFTCCGGALYEVRLSTMAPTHLTL